MSFTVEDLDDGKRFKLFLTIQYKELVQFVFDYLKKKSGLIYFFWSACLLFLFVAIIIRIEVAGHFPLAHILVHLNEFQKFLK